MKKLILVAFLFLLVVGCLPSFAQSNELAITGGGQFSSNSFFDSGTSWAVGANFAHRVAGIPFVGLYLEVPVVVGPKSVLKISSTDYSSLFVTPGLKVKFAPSFFISPYVAGGVGFARFRVDATNSTPEQTRTNAVFDIGAGLDMKIAPFLSLRGEVRDFYSGLPTFDLVGSGLSGRQHNVVPQAGLVFRF
jgi:opacity protein-like surface antigen